MITFQHPDARTRLKCEFSVRVRTLEEVGSEGGGREGLRGATRLQKCSHWKNSTTESVALPTVAV